MKKLILSLVAIATISLSSFGQAPEGFKYQAVVRDAGNLILNNQAVGMRMTIQQGSIGGTTVYQETFSPTTNAYGLVNLEIGSGTPVSGDFATIDWANGPYFIETAVDVTGGTSYAVMGTSQLMSVPYALHSKTAESVTNDMVDDADADSTNELQTISRLGTTVTLSNGGGTFQDSVGVYTAGTGIDITNNVISTEPTYTIGLWPELGGYVFMLSADGKHGVVAEISDQGIESSYGASQVATLPLAHSTDGARHFDWRLPSYYELTLMEQNASSIGGFQTGIYLSSSEFWIAPSDEYFLGIDFSTGSQVSLLKSDFANIRAVRSF